MGHLKKTGWDSATSAQMGEGTKWLHIRGHVYQGKLTLKVLKKERE
jgi:hypothetical protein